jgi:hypothetical protein
MRYSLIKLTLKRGLTAEEFFGVATGTERQNSVEIFEQQTNRPPLGDASLP